jgi:hypothetical protein
MYDTPNIFLDNLISIKTKQNDYHLLDKIENQTEELCIEAIKQNYQALKFVKNQTLKICKEAIKININAYFYIRDKTFDINLMVVKNTGWMIKYIKNQTLELCWYAVQQDGLSLEYVNEIFKTEFICFEAISQNPFAIMFIINQTPSLCKFAFNLNPECVPYITLERRTKFTKITNKNKNKIVYECPICLNSEKEQYVKTECGHIFGTKCLEKWIKIKNDCPCCREKFKLEFI